MAIERYNPDDKDKIAFRFLTTEEGREALKMAIDLVADKCGDFLFLPTGMDGIIPMHGYVAFRLCGDKKAVSMLMDKKVRDTIKEVLQLSDDDLDSIVSPHLSENRHMKKALEFYADRKNYGHDGEIYKPGDSYSLDLGQIARDALTSNVEFSGQAASLSPRSSAGT